MLRLKSAALECPWSAISLVYLDLELTVSVALPLKPTPNSYSITPCLYQMLNPVQNSDSLLRKYLPISLNHVKGAFIVCLYLNDVTTVLTE